MSDHTSSNRERPARMGRGLVIAVAGVIGLLTLNWVLAVARFQVNGLFSDQWNLSEAILRGDGPLSLFTWQHGPHRQGVAFVFTSWVWQLSGWDTRVEALVAVAWLVLAAVLVLAWKYRMTGRLGLIDLWLPIAVLGMRQYETIITTPNLSHSVFPLVLLLMAAWGLARPMTWSSWFGVGIIGVIALFTGFGIFVWAGLVWVFALQLFPVRHMARWRSGMGVLTGGVILLTGLGCFVYGYALNSASSGATFPHWPPTDYAKFVVAMLASRMDLTGGTELANGAGWVMLALSILALVHASWRVSRDEKPPPAMMVAAMLLAAGLGYAVFTAAGRVHLGVVAGEAPRYTSLMVACWLGVFAWSCATERQIWRLGAVGLGWAMVIAPWTDLKDRELIDWPGTMGMSDATRVAIEYSNNQKIEWLSVWEETGSWETAEAAVPKAIHGQAVEVKMGEKIETMRAHRLSFASEPETPLAWLPWWNPKGVTWVRAMGGVKQQWMAEEAVLLIDGRGDGYLNLRVAWKAEAMPEDAEMEIRLGDHRAQMSYREMLAGVSIPASPERQKLTLRTLSGVVPLDPANDPRLGSFLVVEPTLSSNPEYAVRSWVDDAEGLWPEESLVVREGFHGWEENGAFGWSEARLVVAVRSWETRYLNVAIESRFAAVDQGPVYVSINGESHVLPWLEEGLNFSVEIAGGKSHEIVLENSAGAQSPAAVGNSSDTRKLALRINRLSFEAEPAYPDIEHE